MKKSNLFFALLLILTSTLFLSCQKEDSFTNNPPVIEDQQFSVNENSPNGTLVDTVKAADADKNQILKYSIFSGNFNAAFRIDSLTGVIYVNDSLALDFEKVTVFELGVRVKDNYKNPLTACARVTILINNVNELPLNGLVAYYPFNGNANDESGNNHNGTVYGATLTADRLSTVNSAYHFNGIDQYIELPNSSSLKPQFPFSISFWVKLEEYSNTNQILTNDFELENYTGVWFVVSINGNLIANYGNGGYISLSSRKSKMGNTTLQLNQWYHIVGVFVSASQMEIYINGINDGGVYSGGATSLVYSDSSGAIGRKDIGDSTQPPYYFKGSVDEVAFYNRVLNTSEIVSINGVK